MLILIYDKNKEIRDRLIEIVADDKEIETESKNAVNLINDLVSKIESNEADSLHVEKPSEIDEKGRRGYFLTSNI